MTKKERVLIVSRTKMYADACIGAMTLDGKSLRLLDTDGEKQSVNSDFQVGQVWIITYKEPPSQTLIPPHLEDVHVIHQQFEKTVHNMRETLLHKRLIGDGIWKGNLTTLYNHKLKFTPRGSAYIARDNVPDRSTWFWLLDADMILDDRNYYRYEHDDTYKIKYVGFKSAISKLVRGTMLRVSLSRWFRPNPHMEEGCYLQLSGWY